MSKLYNNGKPRVYRKSVLERFHDKYIPEPNSGCWLWFGSLCNTRYGYGSFRIDGCNDTAHRASWRLHRGPITKGMHVDHKCRNPACVNPAHLQVVTPQENYLTRQLEKTHCRKGHALAGENLLLENDGRIRRCRKCRAASRAEFETRVRRCEAA